MSGINEIERSSNQLGGVAPAALAILSSKFGSRLYNSDYGLRHPFGIYTVSLEKVLGSFEELLEVLEKSANHDLTSKKLDVGWDDDLLLGLERLLYSIMEHFDDCESIIKSFLAPGSKHGEVPEVGGYSNAIDAYRTHIGKVVNHIKHKQGRIRSIALYDEIAPHLGYFVEGPSEDESLGPAPLIHPGGNTAFSYARDLRLHMHGLYYTSQQLAKAVASLGAVEDSSSEFELSDDGRFKALASQIQQLDMVVFPDELNKNFPVVTIEAEKTGAYSIRTSLKRQPHGLRTIPSPFRVVIFYQTDGVSRAFRMPYSK